MDSPKGATETAGAIDTDTLLVEEVESADCDELTPPVWTAAEFCTPFDEERFEPEAAFEVATELDVWIETS